MKPNFLFALNDESGQFVAIDPIAKAVTTYPANTPKYFDLDPKDFASFQVSATRDLLGTGMFLKYTFPMEFAKDIKRIIQDALYKKGYTAALKLTIYKKDHTTQQYNKYVSADLDFKQFVDKKADKTASLNLIDNSVNGLLKANENVIYDIPLDDPKAVTLKMVGVELKNHATFVITNALTTTNIVKGHVMPMQIAAVDGVNKADVHSRDFFAYTSYSNDVAGKDLYFFNATTTKDITVSYDFTLTLTDSATATNYSLLGVRVYIARRRGTSNTIEHTLLDVNDSSTYLNTTHTITGSATINTQPGDYFYLVANLYALSGGGLTSTDFIKFTYNGNANFDLRFYSKFPDTEAKAMRPIDVLQKVVAKATNNKCLVQSNFLTTLTPAPYNDTIDNIPRNTLLTCGNAIRQVSGASIKVSLKKLMKFFTSRYCVGQQLENGNVLRIEPLRDQYKLNNVVATFEDVRDLQVSIAQDLIFSNVRAGYNTEAADVLNSKDEFNRTIEMTFPTGIAGAEALDLVSDLRPDIFSIEQLRQDTQDRESVANKDDTAVFLIECETNPDGAGKYAIMRRAGNNIGVNSPTTVYNQGLTPKRCIIANMPRILGCLPDTKKGIIKFASTEGNPDFRTSLGAGSYPATLVIETADIDLSRDIFANAAPLYKPYYFTFTTVSAGDILPAILANPYGEIKFKHTNGLYYRGFIIDMGVKLSKKDVYKIKLICSPDIDVKTLIDSV